MIRRIDDKKVKVSVGRLRIRSWRASERARLVASEDRSQARPGQGQELEPYDPRSHIAEKDTHGPLPRLVP